MYRVLRDICQNPTPASGDAAAAVSIRAAAARTGASRRSAMGAFKMAATARTTPLSSRCAASRRWASPCAAVCAGPTRSGASSEQTRFKMKAMLSFFKFQNLKKTGGRFQARVELALCPTNGDESAKRGEERQRPLGVGVQVDT